MFNFPMSQLFEFFKCKTFNYSTQWVLKQQIVAYLCSISVISPCNYKLNNFVTPFSFREQKNSKAVRLSPEEQIQYMIKDKNKKGPRAQVDARFIAEFKVIWKIMIPSMWSKESGFMVLIALSLISRSICDLWLIQQTTLVEG